MNVLKKTAGHTLMKKSKKKTTLNVDLDDLKI